jgi:hypothetical protein
LTLGRSLTDRFVRAALVLAGVFDDFIDFEEAAIRAPCFERQTARTVEMRRILAYGPGCVNAPAGTASYWSRSAARGSMRMARRDGTIDVVSTNSAASSLICALPAVLAISVSR